jgi:hypothetical protein
VHGQRGLADARRAGDGGDDHRARRLGGQLREQLVERGELVVAAGEGGDVAGQLRGHDAGTVPRHQAY